MPMRIVPGIESKALLFGLRDYANTPSAVSSISSWLGFV